MADDEVRLDAALPDRREHCQARRHERGLLHVGRHELGLGRFEADANEVEAGGLAGALEDVHRLRDRLRDLTAHARLERALARETEGDLPAHLDLGSVHSSKAEPQVSPAPIPVMSTSFPSRRRPSACAWQ